MVESNRESRFFLPFLAKINSMRCFSWDAVTAECHFALDEFPPFFVRHNLLPHYVSLESVK